MAFLTTNHLFQPRFNTSFFVVNRVSNKAFIPAALLMATGGMSLTAQHAIAQESAVVNPPGPVMEYNRDTGVVEVDNNTFNLRTGDFENTSNIPLPTLLPEITRQGVALPVDRTQLVPNTVELSVDEAYIREALDNALDERRGEATYVLTPNSVELTTRFNLSYRAGSHAYGEGIEVTVTDQDGEETFQEAAFVRGDRVRRGPNNRLLPSSDSVQATYGTTDAVTLRVLNLRRDGFEPRESGIYFSESGEFIVEDLQNGGDLDFDDGEYVRISGGRGEAEATVRESEIKIGRAHV